MSPQEFIYTLPNHDFTLAKNINIILGKFRMFTKGDN